jgi:hypothetical protein
MRCSKNSREMDERFARFKAEDQIVNYLGKLPPQITLATALNVELSLATSWEEEQSEMIRQGDPREVVQIFPSDFDQLNAAINKNPAGILSDADAEQHVIALLAAYPPHWAWWIAHKVANWAAVNARMKHM